MNNEIIIIKELIYDKCELQLTNLIVEKESQAYHACTFNLNNSKVIFRKAKVTPTKTGQFVTVWKRIGDGPIQPFELSDEFDFVVINTRKNDHYGQFVFPKSVLIRYGIISTPSKEGKRGFRVYPPWDTVTSAQAQKTQKWQSAYFLTIDLDKPMDVDRVKMLYARPRK